MISDIWILFVCIFIFIFGLFYYMIKSELGESKMSTVIAVLLGQFMGIIIILNIFYSFFNW